MMNCPPEIAAIILDIIQMGILQIRYTGWSGHASSCARQADHIHDLPDLLKDYSEPKLRYYWEVERPCFIERAFPSEAQPFDALWNDLCHHIAGAESSV